MIAWGMLGPGQAFVVPHHPPPGPQYLLAVEKRDVVSPIHVSSYHWYMSVIRIPDQVLRKTRLALFASACIVGVSVGTWLVYGEYSFRTMLPIDWASSMTPSPIPIPRPKPTCPAHALPNIRPSDVLFASDSEAGNTAMELELDEPWLADNNARLRTLFRCLEDGNCAKNQDKGGLVTVSWLRR